MPTPKTIPQLRRFGLTMAAAFGVLGGLATWRGKVPGPYLLGLAALFLLAALLVPRGLAPVERLWLAFGERLAAVMNRVVLFLTFFLVITPVGLLMRLFGKDSLGRKFDRQRDSYWVPVEPDGPCSRSDRPY